MKIIVNFFMGSRKKLLFYIRAVIMTKLYKNKEKKPSRNIGTAFGLLKMYYSFLN